MNIKSGTIQDDINLLARTCTLNVANTGRAVKPIAEVAFTQDTETLSVTSVRPYGAQVTLRAAYNSIPSYEILTANIEYLDDVTDADKYDFNMDLSQMPVGHPHKKRVSFIFNSFATLVSTATEDPNSTTLTNHDIIHKVAALAGIPVGRIDLPVVRVLGTYEVIRQTCVQVAQAFCEPFNMFEFQHYFVRCDQQNGLQIIKVDYQDPVAGGPAYIISNAKEVRKGYEMYMPDNRIGDDDRFLIGATIPGITMLGDVLERRTIETTLFTSSRAENVNNTPIGGSVPVSNVSGFVGETVETPGGKARFDEWSETYTKLRLVIEIRRGADLVVPEDASFEFLVKMSQANNDVMSLNVINSNTLSVDTYNYDSVNGLLSSTHQANTYDIMEFRESSIYGSFTWREVITATETSEFSYPNKVKIPISLERKRNNFNESGNIESTITYSYLGMRGAWYLQTVKTDTNTDLDFKALSYLTFGYDIRGDVVARHSSTRPTDIFALDAPTNTSAFSTKPKVPDTTGELSKIPMSVYQLFNGLPMSQYVDKFRELYADKGLTDDVLNTRLAFTVNLSYMDYDGLRLIDDLILRQKAIEKQNPYWETVNILTTADYTPMAGIPLVAYGAAGVCEVVRHVITPDEVTTQIKLRRLVLIDRSILNA
jgi:hypothetical protein